MTPRCKTSDKKLSEEYKRGDVEFVPLTVNGIIIKQQQQK